MEFVTETERFCSSDSHAYVFKVSIGKWFEPIQEELREIEKESKHDVREQADITTW